MKSRYETRKTIERLLELARRPGTPAEGEAALAAAERLAAKYGFSIRRTVHRRFVRPDEFRYNAAAAAGTGLCNFCGKRFTRAHTGRPARFCSTRCRVAWHRQGQRVRGDR